MRKLSSIELGPYRNLPSLNLEKAADGDLCLPLLELQVGTMKADLHLRDLLLGMGAMEVDLTEDLKRIIHQLGITMRLPLEVGRCIGEDLL